ncbi:MAG: 50S ribosomal protein L10 [Candidatus Peregrinibacteria bacterium]
MAITKQKKEEVLQSLIESFGRSKSVVFIRNKGLSVQDDRSMRGLLRAQSISFKVAKKTLFQIAADENHVEDFEKDLLEGAVGAAFCETDEVLPAKLIAEFAKKNDKLELIGGVVDGKFLNQAAVIELSKLPSKEELYAKFMGSLLAPLTGFVGVSSNLISGFVRALDQVREQKEAA